MIKKACFTTKILTRYLQSIFEAPYRLRDIIYDQRHNFSFYEKLRSGLYKATWAITGAIQETSRQKIFQEFCLESLKSRLWFTRFCFMFKIMKNKAPKYIISLISMRTNPQHKKETCTNILLQNRLFWALFLFPKL